MRTLRVEVTRYHINNGRRKDCRKCPIAIAMTPLLPAGYFAIVGPITTMIRMMLGNDDVFVDSVMMPSVVHQWISAYDAGEPMGPFAFEIDMDLWNDGH